MDPIGTKCSFADNSGVSSFDGAKKWGTNSCNFINCWFLRWNERYCILVSDEVSYIPTLGKYLKCKELTWIINDDRVQYSKKSCKRETHSLKFLDIIRNFQLVKLHLFFVRSNHSYSPLYYHSEHIYSSLIYSIISICYTYLEWLTWFY